MDTINFLFGYANWKLPMATLKECLECQTNPTAYITYTDLLGMKR
jgi:hypothetical protein